MTPAEQKRIDGLAVAAIIADNLPLDVFQFQNAKELFSLLNPAYQPPTAKDVKRILGAEGMGDYEYYTFLLEKGWRGGVPGLS